MTLAPAATSRSGTATNHPKTSFQTMQSHCATYVTMRASIYNTCVEALHRRHATRCRSRVGGKWRFDSSDLHSQQQERVSARW